MNRNSLTREILAEFIGTFVLITFGAANVAQVVLSHEKNGVYLSINIAWGIAVMMGIFVAGGVSGAHLNPAVTVANAVCRDFSWSKVFPYCAAQVAGAFCGAATAFFLYHEAFTAFDKGVRQISGEFGTAGIFATYPAPYLSTFGGFVDQFIGTMMLMLVIAAIGDARNNSTLGNLGPIAVGLLVIVIGASMGMNAGYAINPARDLGPRLFTFVAGWGAEVFRANNYYFWVPIVGPILGGIAGMFVYDLFVGKRFPREQ
ncbi:MAG: MIP family channel protein [Blastocatellia bacterium]|nr:MIP family channel protein [Blastocatellia bacterium]